MRSRTCNRRTSRSIRRSVCASVETLWVSGNLWQRGRRTFAMRSAPPRPVPHHQQYECQPHHGINLVRACRAGRNLHHGRITDINRMPAANDDLGEQIVQLLPDSDALRAPSPTVSMTPTTWCSWRSSEPVTLEPAAPGSQLSSWIVRHPAKRWIDESRARGRRTRLFAPEELGQTLRIHCQRPGGRSIGAGSDGAPAGRAT